ncbi:hypothetical protein CKM354_000338600 [Cercospora kikuchii]|uniref:Transcription factor domain-containing protein n=1 Tax=Cercospora kikuchii TaxID=84275 RepID=A0A9P3CHM9_9PEZI|nr:uncharacterized protein CKM354_000338600 [Cercospora kikuchii]GIZ40030.1 hypothetical protein CKM354_000338600 [Cercospora kikuchii]
MHDQATLRRIRRHAMKDIGFQRRRPKKKRNISIQLEFIEDLTSSSTSGHDSGYASPLLTSPAPAIGGGSIHTFFHLPIELDDIGKGLLANIWTSDYSISCQSAHRPDWFMTGIADEATFYQVLANSELYFEVLRSPQRSQVGQETSLSMFYHQKAVTLQRKRLENVSKTQVTEAMLGTAASLLLYAEMSGNADWWLPQQKGMLEMVRAFEGGLAALDRNRPLRAACSWAELRGAFVLELSCGLPLPSWWQQEYDRGINGDHGFAILWAAEDPGLRDEFSKIFGHVPQWLETLDAIATLAGVVSSRLQKAASIRQQQDDVLLWADVIAHRLLCFRANDTTLSLDDNQRSIFEACRLTLLIFVAVIYRCLGAHPYNTTILLQKQQQRLLRLQSVDWKGLRKLLVWMELIASLEGASFDVMHVPKDKLQQWLLEKQLGLTNLLSHSFNLATVKQVLWLPELFDLKVTAFVKGEWHREWIKKC